MQISLFTCNAERNRVDKTEYLSNRFALDGVIKRQTSVINLTIEISKSEITPHLYNYLYISKFNRYYFIDDIQSVANNRWLLICSCDVLMSFKNDIYNMTAIIDKAENDNASNVYLNDGSYVMDTRNHNQVIEFPNGLDTDGHYILICAGGN